MTLIRKFIIGMSILLADIIFLSCCLYLTVIADKMEQIAPNPLLWIGLILIGYLVNLNIVKQKTSIGPVAIWNVIWMIVIAVVVALTFDCQPNSIPMKIFVCGVLIVIQGHSIAQAILPHRAESHLTFLDIQVVVFAIFLAGCHLKQLQDVMGLQILGFLSLGYTLAALIFLRTAEEQVAVVKGDSVAGRAKVFGLLGGIVAVSCFLCAVLAIMAQHATRGLLDIFLLLLAAIKTGLQRIGAVCTRIFSKIPSANSEGVLPQGSTSETIAEETGAEAIMRLPDWLLPLVGIVIAAIIIFFILRLLYKLRKEKITISKKNFQAVEITSNKLTREKTSLLKRLIEKWKLRLKMYRGRRTTEGLAVLLRKAGKSVGVQMQPGDSWHGYVLRLMPYGDETELLALAAHFKEHFYSNQPVSLSSNEYARFSHCLRNLKKIASDE